MRVREYGLAIILNAFLGYLWILFINHIVNFANSINDSFVIGGLIVVLGTVLFFEIVHRITPFNQYKLKHPIKITGIVSFVLVVAIHLLGFNLV